MKTLEQMKMRKAEAMAKETREYSRPLSYDRTWHHRLERKKCPIVFQ